jgi:hypothetical protein
MAGRVPDTQEDGLLLGTGLRERRFAPRQPLHGIVRMLQKVGRFLASERIGHDRSETTK